jgi:hypothetical protein
MNIEISADHLVGLLSRDEGLELIKTIDMRFSEIDFTLAFLKDRIDSLKSDMSSKEIKKELNL